MATAHAQAAPSAEVEAFLTGEYLTIEEAVNRYPRESVLIRIRDEDAQHLPIKGYVLAHSPDEQAIDALADREPLKSLLAEKNPTDGYYAITTYPRWFSDPESAANHIRHYSEYILEQRLQRATR